MQTAIDLPIRQGIAPRVDQHEEPRMFEWPPFMYWVKAGIGLAIGSVIVSAVARVLQVWFSIELLMSFARAVARH